MKSLKLLSCGSRLSCEARMLDGVGAVFEGAGSVVFNYQGDKFGVVGSGGKLHQFRDEKALGVAVGDKLDGCWDLVCYDAKSVKFHQLIVECKSGYGVLPDFNDCDLAYDSNSIEIKGSGSKYLLYFTGDDWYYARGYQNSVIRRIRGEERSPEIMTTYEFFCHVCQVLRINVMRYEEIYLIPDMLPDWLNRHRILMFKLRHNREADTFYTKMYTLEGQDSAIRHQS